MEENKDLMIVGCAVQAIKTAILQSQQRALRGVNQEQLALYYGIGRFISANTRNKNWGKGVIEAISDRLLREMPGLKGFSATNMRKMRTFFEAWRMLSVNSFVPANELSNNSNLSVQTDEITFFCKSANKKFVEYVIQDYDKPMGVATYKTAADMDDHLKKVLPSVEELKKLL